MRKTYISRAICWLMAMALAMLPTLAQECNVYCPSGIVNPYVRISSDYQEKDLAQRHEQARKAATATSENVCTVTLNLKYDSEVYQAPYMALLLDNNDLQGNWMEAYNMGQGFLRGQVAPGTYDIVASFMDYNSYEPYYVILERCEIIADVSYTLNPDLCTNHISTKYYAPDGELLKHGMGHFDENDNFVIDQEGNVDYTNVSNILYLKGAGILEIRKLIYGGPTLHEETQTAPFDIHFNNISDRYLFIQQRTDLTEDNSKTFVNYVSTNNIETAVLENEPDSYIHQQNTYKYSPLGVQEFGYGFQDIFGLISQTDNSYLFSSIGTIINDNKPGDIFSHDVWANIPYTDPYVPELEILVQQNFADNGEVEVSYYEGEEYMDYTPTGWTRGLPLRVKNGQKFVTNIGNHKKGRWGMEINPIFLANINNVVLLPQYLPAPDPLTYPANLVLDTPGGNCPINAINVTSYENDGLVSVHIQDFFVGRYGETPYCNIGVSSSLRFNGEEVDLESFAPEGKGTLEWTCTNTNVEVDDLPGHNTTTVYFDQNQEDMTPPSIEMLQFKNSEGGVTDRFTTAADGTMEFYASDFHYHYYPELWGGVFECQPVEVLVEYAPYSTDNWNELTVEEIPELFQKPGWGYFYRGSLAGVIGQAEKGWFDLKIRLEDAAGNWQEQVVSPAFRIDDLAYTSVANIGDDNAHEVARYSIDGKRVDASHRGVTIIKMSDGTARKVIN